MGRGPWPCWDSRPQKALPCSTVHLSVFNSQAALVSMCVAGGVPLPPQLAAPSLIPQGSCRGPCSPALSVCPVCALVNVLGPGVGKSLRSRGGLCVRSVRWVSLSDVLRAEVCVMGTEAVCSATGSGGGKGEGGRL